LAKGVYIFETPSGHTYVGSSINLFVRVTSYFYNSILKSGTRAVLVYFFKHGFEGVVLTLYVMNPNSSIEQILIMEQYFLDHYFNHPLNLNTDNIASGSGKHYPMSETAKQRLRKQRGIAFFIYDITTASLVGMFYSKTHAKMHMSIDHRTLDDCLTNGTLYLGRFIISLEIMTELHHSFEPSLSLTEFKDLINYVKVEYRITNQPVRKQFTALNVKNPSSPLCGTYNSIGEFARKINVDRGSIRPYINGEKPAGSLYKNEWLLSSINE